jgi:hypothetical protein
LSGRWDNYQELIIQEKIDDFNNLTIFEKSQVLKYIVFKYMRLKSIKLNIKSYDDVRKTMSTIIEDPLFRQFTFNQYRVFIYHDRSRKSVCIGKVRDEILSFIGNRGNLSDEELLVKLKRIIQRSRLFQEKLSGYLARDR